MTGGPCLCRCLIPLRSLARRLAALRFCPRSGKRRGLQQRCFISGLYHAASELAVYASQSASRRPTQDSLAAGGQPFAARDWLPAGHHRSFNHSLHGILFSRLGLAQFPWKPRPSSREGVLGHRWPHSASLRAARMARATVGASWGCPVARSGEPLGKRYFGARSAGAHLDRRAPALTSLQNQIQLAAQLHRRVRHGEPEHRGQ